MAQYALGSARTREIAVFVMQLAIVLLCVAGTAIAALGVQESRLRDAATDRVLSVAQSIARLDQVVDAIGTVDASATLQPIADLVGAASGVAFVVITDADGVRLTHPNPAQRGKVVSTDPGQVLRGETFIGTEEGTLGRSLRAKVPVRRDGEVVGMASVGILESDISAELAVGVNEMGPWIAGALVLGCSAAASLTYLVNRRVRRLESELRVLDSQRRVARALREQTHEFTTRLHVLYGLVEHGDNAEALDYIAALVPVDTGAARMPHIDDVPLQAVLELAARESAKNGGTVHVDPESTAPSGVLVDEDLVVLSNLLRNAIEASGAGGSVEVWVHADDSTLDMVVSDTGPGIDPAIAHRMFEHGFTTKRGDRGSGLGLVMRIVGRRGGQLDIARSPSGGAQFIVRMDLVPGRVRESSS